MAKDMTTGKITPLLISFTIPLVMGNMLQLLYNAVDSIIVGRFVGEEALAAVGTSNPLMTLIILFISGLCMGAGVLMGMLYGAKDYEKLQRQISSTMIGGLLFSVAITIISVIVAPVLFKIMHADESVMDIAVVNRIDDFAYTPQQNIGHAMTSLLAQNKGAGKKERIKEGFCCGMKIEFVYGMIVCLICFVFSESLMCLFAKEEEVIRLGVQYLHLIAIMYLLPAATNGIQGFFRGTGDLKVTLLSSFINMGVRVLAAIPLVFLCRLGMAALPFSYLCGWVAMLIVEVPLLRKEWKKIQK